jgi:signal transduction histidine kinase
MPGLLHADYQVQVLAPFGKDAALVREVLERSGIPVSVVDSGEALARCVNNGAGAAIVAEEALTDETIELLGNTVAAQPAWSDFPIIVLTGGGASTPSTEMLVRSRAPMGNITLIERPLRPATLISSVRTAIRSRLRQYEIRDHLEERQRKEEELRRNHDELESLVEKRTLALRKLSARLMRVQDEERRRVARELHDGLGQWLAAAEINIDLALHRGGGKAIPILQETRKLIDHAVSSIRTMSYLLHPPLLDEAGFDAAARWYIEGLARRTGIRIKVDFSHEENSCSAAEYSEGAKTSRLPDAFELALFRALQEGLTNVHRHSSSSDAVVRFQRLPDRAVLEIQDFGRGMPPQVVERFQRTGTGSGVGLAGIRERIKEIGGDFTIFSNANGTLLRAIVPLSLSTDESADAKSASPNVKEMPVPPAASKAGD